jgi:hypothetical protein
MCIVTEFLSQGSLEDMIKALVGYHLKSIFANALLAYEPPYSYFAEEGRKAVSSANCGAGQRYSKGDKLAASQRDNTQRLEAS